MRAELSQCRYSSSSEEAESDIEGGTISAGKACHLKMVPIMQSIANTDILSIITSTTFVKAIHITITCLMVTTIQFN